MLDVRHFHVVFTLPAELRPLARFAPRVVFDALMQAAHRTLVEVSQHRHGATVGATTVLHTWTRKLEFHPHVHALVTAGGLSADGQRWCATSPGFSFRSKSSARSFAAR